MEECTDSRDLRPLTLDTFDCSIKLYATFSRAITGYSTFTLARAGYRAPKLSTLESSRIRYQFADRGVRTPDDEETSRIWKGFLLYEVTCLMQGVPQIMAAASGEVYRAPKELRDKWTSRCTSEEVMCVQQYVREQYDLAFNELVQSFEAAVARVGLDSLETSTPPTDAAQPIAELECERLQDPVGYLFEPPFSDPNPWATKTAALGISFLQRFVSLNRSNRIDFIRISYPFLSNSVKCPLNSFLGSKIAINDVRNKNFGWSDEDMSDWNWSSVIRDTSMQLRLRAVGWIFWENRERLFLMDLHEYQVDDTYGLEGRLLPHLRLQGRLNLLEELVKPQEWEPIVQYFGPTPSEKQLDDIKGLFKSMDDLNPASIAAVVSALDCQAEEDAQTEATVSGE